MELDSFLFADSLTHIVYKMLDDSTLFDAVSKNKIDLVSSYLNKGGDVNRIDDKGYSILNRAATDGNLNLVKIILEKKPDLETVTYPDYSNDGSMNYDGATALHNAAYGGFSEIVEALIQAGADINLSNRYYSPIQVAIMKGRHKVVKILLNANAIVDNDSACVDSAHYGLEDLALTFLDRGASIEAMDAYGFSIMHFACVNGLLSLLKRLVACGVDTKESLTNGATPFMVAAENIETEILLVEPPIDEGSRVQGNYRGRGKWYSGKVTRNRGDGTFDILYDDGESEVSVSETLIRVAKREPESVTASMSDERAIEQGSCVEGNFRNAGQWYAGEITQDHGDGTYDIAYDDGDNEFRVAKTSIRLVARLINIREAIFYLLLDKSQDVDARGRFGQTALIHVALKGVSKSVSMLLNAGADVNATNNNGESALALAATTGSVACVKLLMDAGADVNVIYGLNKYSILYGVAYHDPVADETDFDTILWLLIDAGADINFCAAWEYAASAIEGAYFKGNKKIVESLAKAGARDTNKVTLFTGLRDNNLDMVRTAINQGVNVNTLDPNALLPILSVLRNELYATSSECPPVVDLLIDSGADTNAIDRNGESVLLAATQSLCPLLPAFMVKILSRGADINFKAHNQSALLRLASQFKWDYSYADINSAINVLIEWGIDFLYADPNGNTALNYCAWNGNEAMALKLIGLGCDINALEITTGRTPLLSACYSGYQPIIASLVQAGADVEVVDLYGMTPLISVASKGFLESTKLLIDAGASKLKREANSNQTAYEYANQNGYKDVAKYLRMLYM